MVAEAEATSTTDDDEDYIAATFERMATSMRTPSNTMPTVRHHRRRLEYYFVRLWLQTKTISE